MLKGKLSSGAFFLGLDAENVRRLQAGQPIVLSLAEIGGTDDIVITYGETLDAIMKEIEKATGKPVTIGEGATTH